MNQTTQPHPDWPWSLSEGGNIVQTFSWENIEYDLSELYPSNDSFLILEQRDPANDEHYWYIQCAIALAGPNKDSYVVGIGWGGASGRGYIERCFDWKDLDAVIQLFEQAFQRKALDLTGFEDQSDMLF